MVVVDIEVGISWFWRSRCPPADFFSRAVTLAEELLEPACAAAACARAICGVTASTKRQAAQVHPSH